MKKQLANALDLISLLILIGGVPEEHGSLKKSEAITRILLFLAFTFIFVNSAGASLEIVDFFPISQAVSFELMHGGNAVESQEILFKINSGAKTREIIVGILKELSRKGQIVIVVTPDTAVAEKTERIITMGGGRIVSDAGAVLNERQRL